MGFCSRMTLHARTRTMNPGSQGCCADPAAAHLYDPFHNHGHSLQEGLWRVIRRRLPRSLPRSVVCVGLRASHDDSVLRHKGFCWQCEAIRTSYYDMSSIDPKGVAACNKWWSEQSHGAWRAIFWILHERMTTLTGSGP